MESSSCRFAYRYQSERMALGTFVDVKFLPAAVVLLVASVIPN